MVNIKEILIQENYGRFQLQRVEVTENTAIAFVCVPKDVKIMTDSAIRNQLLRMKKDLIEIDLPQEITFVMFQGKRIYASGVDSWQRFCCEIKDPTQYMTKMFLSKKSNWVTKMIEATSIADRIGSYEVEREVVSTEEAVRICERLGVI